MKFAALLPWILAGLTLAAAPVAPGPAPDRPVRIVLLHHSTGEVVWKGGLPEFFTAWNAAHGTRYQITELDYPNAAGGHLWLRRHLPFSVFRKLIPRHYPWDNQPYDYWNLWVAHTGADRDRAEWNLDDLVRSYDVIVFKHCYPVSAVQPEAGTASVSSHQPTLANYQLQYQALRARMRQFPNTRFIVWTPTALAPAESNPGQAARAGQFSTWVKERWDEKGDNIFIWDFRELETGGGPFVKPEYLPDPQDSHPGPGLGAMAAPLLGKRIVDVIEGRGDSGSLTGR